MSCTSKVYSIAPSMPAAERHGTRWLRFKALLVALAEALAEAWRMRRAMSSKYPFSE